MCGIVERRIVYVVGMGGELQEVGSRAAGTSRAKVTIVDPGSDCSVRIAKVVGWECNHEKKKIENWVEGWACSGPGL